MQTPFAFAEADLKNRPSNENRPSNDDLKQAQFIAKSCKAEYQKSLPPPYSSLSKVAKKLEETGQEYLLSEAEAEVYAKRSADLANCLIKTTEKNQNLYLKNAEININITGVDDNYDTLIEFQGAVPLWTDKNENKALFLHPGFVLSINSETKSHIDKNFGLVYRFTVSRGVIGVNVFYDQSDITEKFDGEKSKFTHRRGSVGLDYQSGQNYLATNYYFPITGWVDINEYYREHVLGGIDLIFKRLISKKLSLKLSLAYWDYSEKRDHINSTVGLGYQLSCNKTIRTDLEYDPAIKDVRSFVRFVFTFGGPKKDPDTCFTKNLKESPDIWKLVERKRELVYERVKKIVRLIIPDQVTPRNISYSYTLSNSNFQSLPIGQTANVLVSEKPDWLTYDFESKTFSGIPTAIGIYRVAGTVSLNNNNKGGSSWSFHITVGILFDPTFFYSSLTIPDQEINEGESFTYTIKDGDISGVEDGETPIIRVTSTNPSINYNAETKTLSSGILNIPGVHMITGTITDGTTSGDWSFSLTVRDNTAPTLTIADQTAEAGTVFSYEIKDSEITNLRSGEMATIRVTSTSNPTIIYDDKTKIFSSDRTLKSVREHMIMGTIKDEAGNSNDWSFKLTVKDTMAPMLVTSRQTVNEGGSLKYTLGPANFVVRDGETAIITVTSTNPAITYDDKTRTLSSGPLNVMGMYEVTGTISDGTTSSTWEFTLIVQKDGTTPELDIPDQIAEAGETLSFRVRDHHYTGVENGKTPTIKVAGNALAISYDDKARKLISGPLNIPGVHMITGTISDDGGENSNDWKFTLTVKDTIIPQLNIEDQTAELGTVFSYKIKDGDITKTRDGETPTIRVTAGNHPISYDPATEIFSSNQVLNLRREYTITGTISDEVGNSSPWSFKLSVIPVNSAPMLNIPDQTINNGKFFSYTIKDSDITGLRQNEIAIITVESTPMEYNAKTKTISSFRKIDGRLSQYKIMGTISDGTNSRPWEFILTVKDIVPQLNIEDQTAELGTKFSYKIKASDITGLRQDETAIITVTSSNPSVIYDDQTKIITSLDQLSAVATYMITGTISDGKNSSTWQFTLTVKEVDLAPTLNIEDQTVEAGNKFSYTIKDGDITGLREDETAIIEVTSHTNIIYNAETKTFSNNQNFNELRSYVIRGTIGDGAGNSKTWEFILTVEDTMALTLNIEDQIAEAGEVFSYTIKDSDIANLRSGEMAIIEVTSTPMLYNERTKTIYSFRPLGDQLRQYKVTGTISDEAGNSKTWEFIVTVEDTTAPIFMVPDKTVRKGGRYFHTITASNIPNRRENEEIRITFGGATLDPFGPQTVSIVVPEDRYGGPGRYWILGTISDGAGNTRDWQIYFDVVP